jgi:hypothetical protein
LGFPCDRAAPAGWNRGTARRETVRRMTNGPDSTRQLEAARWNRDSRRRESRTASPGDNGANGHRFAIRLQSGELPDPPGKNSCAGGVQDARLLRGFTTRSDNRAHVTAAPGPGTSHGPGTPTAADGDGDRFGCTGAVPCQGLIPVIPVGHACTKPGAPGLSATTRVFDTAGQKLAHGAEFRIVRGQGDSHSRFSCSTRRQTAGLSGNRVLPRSQSALPAEQEHAAA